jgi:hypothetical protein
MRGPLYIAALGICIVVIYELVGSKFLGRKEHFLASGSGADPSNPIWAQFVPARADVGENREEEGYIADKRYFHGYVDIQRLGMRRDYCRMVVPKGGDEKDAFFACALAGTENLSSIAYRTKSLRDGFLRSRDNYMRDVFGESRDSYCSIIKTGADAFQARCYRAGDLTFNKTDTQDTEPPKDIQTLLGFYEGIMMWYRFYDDMRDCAYVSFATAAGALEINESPDQTTTKALTFNGADQFIRLAETKNLKFGDKTPNRFMRAFSAWVYFDEFTNNAHIFDFGNGAGKDNVFLGIIGRGNAGIQTNEIRDSILCKDQSTLTVPEAPSGAQDVPTVHPKKLMLTSDANCNDFDCKGPAVFGRRMAALQQPATPVAAGAQTADLLYEVWDGKVRAMRVKLNNAVQIKTWTHIAITAKNNDAFQPDVQFWINGELFYTKPAGTLPRTNYTDHNYLGKSNWVAVTSQYDNQDELFKGSMFDFRVYKTPMTSRKIKETYAWGREKLGLKAEAQRRGAANNVMLYEDIKSLTPGTTTGKTFLQSKSP